MKALARALLVLVLLAGWQAALVHPVEHVSEHGELIHLGHGHDREPGSVCDALDDLTAFAPLPLASDASPDLPREEVVFETARIDLAAETPPFLSQGPPSFL